MSNERSHGINAIDPVIVLDGMRVAPADARVSVFDRGFLFGDAVFEVLRVYRRAPFAIDEHLARLARSLDGLAITPSFTIAQLRAEILEAVDGLGEDDAYVRVMVTRGQGALHLDPRRAWGPTTRVVIAAPLLPLPATVYEGVAIASVRAERPTDHTRAAGAKVAAYVSNLLALQVAQSRGAYEAALVGADGSISEGHSSNLFVVTRGTLVTPPISCGILGGITRAMALEEARAEGIAIAERLLFARDFECADEAFLTSSLREIVPITSIDGASIAGGRVGPITTRLHARYRTRVLARVTR